jgi:hypothetical protein
VSSRTSRPGCWARASTVTLVSVRAVTRAGVAGGGVPAEGRSAVSITGALRASAVEPWAMSSTESPSERLGRQP